MKGGKSKPWIYVLAVTLAACVIPGVPPAHAVPVDLELTVLDQLTQVDIVGGTVGFTLRSVSKNVGTNPIPWLFTLKETATTPWVVTNGFSWHGAHDVLLAPPVPTGNDNNKFGQHPHMQFELYRQPAGGGPFSTVQIGESDLKHGFKTADLQHHFLAVGSEDPYGTGENRDRSFYGPISELDPNTFLVAAHDHLGFNAGGGIFERDHGESDHAGNLIDHLLQAPLALMLPQAGVRWFLAGTYFVAEDVNLANNSRWIETFPAWDGSTLTFTYGSGGLDLATIPKLVPEPGTLLLLGSGLAGLVAWRRRTRVHV